MSKDLTSRSSSSANDDCWKGQWHTSRPPKCDFRGRCCQRDGQRWIGRASSLVVSIDSCLENAGRTWWRERRDSQAVADIRPMNRVDEKCCVVPGFRSSTSGSVATRNSREYVPSTLSTSELSQLMHSQLAANVCWRSSLVAPTLKQHKSAPDPQRLAQTIAIPFKDLSGETPTRIGGVDEMCGEPGNKFSRHPTGWKIRANDTISPPGLSLWPRKWHWISESAQDLVTRAAEFRVGIAPLDGSIGCGVF
jgi:hypothetical protein